LVAKAFGRTLSDLGPEFGGSGRVAVPELACALAGIEIEIPTHLMELISEWNTECATNHLAEAEAPDELTGAKNAGTEPRRAEALLNRDDHQHLA
jgi:hypothetical protein